MGRGQNRPAPLSLGSTAVARHHSHVRELTNPKPSYKVVLEQVTQKKKKLIALGSFHTEPPPGYTFVAAGHPQLTARCKELARLEGAKVFVVSVGCPRILGALVAKTSKTSRHNNKELAHQTHRVGYHFPSAIVDRACTSLGLDLSRSGQVLRRHEDWPQEGPKHRRTSKSKDKDKDKQAEQLSQNEIDKQARDAILDLFPTIPKTDLRNIVNHAFELGTARVGAQISALPLPRRVQLAVVAHIRHMYTNYDKLTKQLPWQAARALVEKPTLAKLAEWRGENEEEPNAIEEILREVIVISEDEDEDDGINTTKTNYLDRHAESRMGREESVEIISSESAPQPLQLQPIIFGRPEDERYVATPVAEADGGYSFIGHGQYSIASKDPERVQREEARRLQVWREARDLTRRHPGATQAPPDRRAQHGSWTKERNPLNEVQYRPQPDVYVVDSKPLWAPSGHGTFDQQGNWTPSAHDIGQRLEARFAQSDVRMHDHGIVEPRDTGHLASRNLVDTTQYYRVNDQAHFQGPDAPPRLVRLASGGHQAEIYRSEHTQAPYKEYPTGIAVTAANFHDSPTREGKSIAVAPRERILPSIEGTWAHERARDSHRPQDNKVIILSSPSSESIREIRQPQTRDRLQHVLAGGARDTDLQANAQSTSPHTLAESSKAHEVRYVPAPSAYNKPLERGSHTRRVSTISSQLREKKAPEQLNSQAAQYHATALPSGPLSSVNSTASTFPTIRPGFNSSRHPEAQEYPNSRPHALQEFPRKVILVQEPGDQRQNAGRSDYRNDARNYEFATSSRQVDDRGVSTLPRFYQPLHTGNGVDASQLFRPLFTVPGGASVDERPPVAYYSEPRSQQYPRSGYYLPEGGQSRYLPQHGDGHALAEARPPQAFDGSHVPRGVEESPRRFDPRHAGADIIVLE